VEVVGPSRDASIRVIVSADSDCPTLTADGQPLKMRVRAEPGQMFTEGDLPPPAHFPVRVCEVNAPEGKAKVLLEGNEMPLPRADIQRIIVFGDTGCRIKKRKNHKTATTPTNGLTLRCQRTQRRLTQIWSFTLATIYIGNLVVYQHARTRAPATIGKCGIRISSHHQPHFSLPPLGS